MPAHLDMAGRMELVQGMDFVYVQNPVHKITFGNRSVIMFIEADPTKDRGGKKIKGLNATGNHVDEADELQQEMFIHATSRKGRRNEQGQPSLSIITMNPERLLGQGAVLRPLEGRNTSAAYRRHRVRPLRQLAVPAGHRGPQDQPEWWTQRYLHNNWDYSDESTSLFKSRAWATSLVDSLDATEPRSAGYDVARSGTDRSVRALLYGKTIADVTIVKDKLDQIDTSVLADWLVTDAPASGYGLEKLAVDAVGLGAGVVDGLSKQGYKCKEYMSGAKPDPTIKLEEGSTMPLNFENLRSQMFYLYARGIELGIIKHFSGCPLLKDLQKEAMVHNFKITDKVLSVESEDKIKVRLGASPDILDSVAMGLWVALRKEPVGFRVRHA
jgi:hypothetical protein